MASDFQKEWEKARKAGKKTFIFSGDGKEKNTMKEGESKSAWESALKKNNKKDDSIGSPVIDRALEQARKDLKLNFRISGGDRADKKKNKKAGGAEKSQHLVKGSARDIGLHTPTLTKKDQKRLKEYMLRRGYTSIDESEATKGTGKHLHFDSRKWQLARRMRKPFLGEVETVRDEWADEIIADEEKRWEERKKIPGLADLRKFDESQPKSKKATLKQRIQEKGKPEVKPKGMSRGLQDSLALISEYGKDAIEPALDLTKNTGKQIEEADKLASVEMMSEGALPMAKLPEEEKKKDVVKREKKSPYPTSVKAAIEERTKDLDIEKEKVLPVAPKPKSPPSEPSVASQFKEALTFFAPTMIGALGGALIEGTEGAVAGAEAGTSLGESFRDFKLKEAELGLKAKNIEPTAFEKQKENRIKAHQDANLKFRAAERRSIIGDQELRRFERSENKVTAIKESFGKQEHIKKELEVLRQIQSLNDLAETKVLPGTIGFKLAKGIAGEVGNLTNEEREAAQIEPSVWNRMKRYAAKTFKGEIPAEDVILIKRVSSQLKGKVEGRLRTAADRFSQGRLGQLHEAHSKTFRDDLLLGINIDPNSEPLQKPAIQVDRKSLEAELQRRGL